MNEAARGRGAVLQYCPRQRVSSFAARSATTLPPSAGGLIRREIRDQMTRENSGDDAQMPLRGFLRAVSTNACNSQQFEKLIQVTLTVVLKEAIDCGKICHVGL